MLGSVINFFVFKIYHLEVIVLALIKVGQVPVNTDVFQCHIVPFISVRVVWNFIVMNVFAFSPHTSEFG
jgi:hypothetical protein